MTLDESLKTCFTKYADFHGRATRAEYWWFVLFVGSVGFGANFIDCRLLDQCEDWGGALGWLWQIATLLPALAVGARRLHDIGRSGWWLLLVLTIVGIIPLVVMACFPSQQKANEYGEPSVAKPMPVPHKQESVTAASKPKPARESEDFRWAHLDIGVTAASKPARESVKKSSSLPLALVGCAIGSLLITLLIAFIESESNKETPTARQITQTADINQYVNGKKHGHWVEEYMDYTDPSDPHQHRAAGSYVDGKRQGHWVEHHTDGSAVGEGPYVDGKQHGHWVERFADGTVQEGPYVDGKRHGHWVERFADGTVQEGPYVDGKRHGHWVLRFADGDVYEGPFVDGKLHGHWVERFASGQVEEGPYVDGERHGKWVYWYPTGLLEYRTFRNGEEVN